MRLPAAPPHGRARCPRCGSPVHLRKPDSLARTWALVIAAVILYVPANLLPITHVTSLGHVQSDTIMSGVIYFIQSGSWPIALVIFVASVFVPLLKLVILVYLLISVRRRSRWRRPIDPARRSNGSTHFGMNCSRPSSPASSSFSSSGSMSVSTASTFGCGPRGFRP